MMRLLALLPLLLTLQVTGFVRDGSVTTDFPNRVRFVVNLAIPPADITSAELVLTPADGEPITISVDVTNANLDVANLSQVGENDARMHFAWAIPAENPPPLFSTIDYQWTFTAADGSVGTLSDSFQFSDSRTEWVRSVDPAGQFSVTAARSLAGLVEPLRQVHDLLEANTGRSLSYNLILYDQPSYCDFVSLGQVEGISPECQSLFAGYQVLERPSSAAAEDFFVGMLVQDAYAPLWDGKNVPDWFVDGLVQFYAPSLKTSLLPPAQAASRSSTLYTLSDMRSFQPNALWHAQSYGMVLYIADAITPWGVFQLARVDAASFADAYQAAIGTPQSALIPAWRQWIFTHAAESVYGITPYQPPTLIPTLTVTPSDTPTPTPTPSDTPTITPTPTLTPRGVRTYIAPPTLTPSQTFTPPPPTVTPRPPGSLPTVTATPTALQVTIVSPGFQAGIITFLALLLVLLIFLVIRLGNRR